MGEWTDGSNWDYGTNISRVGVYPWAMGQPDVWYDNHEQHCVTFWIENNWLWDNLWCNTPQYFFCKSNQTQYPTIQPTLSPTTYSFEPTSTEETSSSKRKKGKSKTKIPSLSAPTNVPTIEPTKSPTNTDQILCGESAIIDYKSGNFEINVIIEYETNIIFNASKSEIIINNIEIYNLMERLDNGQFNKNDQTIKYFAQTSGRYIFSFIAETNGIIHIDVDCITLNPTINPTELLIFNQQSIQTTPIPTSFPSSNPGNDSVSKSFITQFPSEYIIMTIFAVFCLLICAVIFIVYYLKKRSVAHINSNDINIEPGLQTKQSSYPPLPESLPRLKTLDSFKQNPLKFKRTVSSSEDMYVNKPKEVNTPTDGDDV